MKILKKSQMPDGTKIQIEDWKKDYTFIKTLSIGTYPIAKNSSKDNLIQAKQTFRLELTNFENDEQVQNIFHQLELGKIFLQDLNKYFYNEEKDKFLLSIL